MRLFFGLYVCGNKLKPSRKAYDTSSHKKGKERSEEKGEEEKEEGRRRRRRKKGRRLVDNNQWIIKNGYLYRVCLMVLMVKKIWIFKK